MSDHCETWEYLGMTKDEYLKHVEDQVVLKNKAIDTLAAEVERLEKERDNTKRHLYEILRFDLPKGIDEESAEIVEAVNKEVERLRERAICLKCGSIHPDGEPCLTDYVMTFRFALMQKDDERLRGLIGELAGFFTPDKDAEFFDEEAWERFESAISEYAFIECWLTHARAELKKP